MNNEIEITPAYPQGEEFNRLMEIRFECLVRAFDFGQREERGIFTSGSSKPRPPQWFKVEKKITLEGIKSADPYELGCSIQEMLKLLEAHIDKYENK